MEPHSYLKINITNKKAKSSTLIMCLRTAWRLGFSFSTWRNANDFTKIKPRQNTLFRPKQLQAYRLTEVATESAVSIMEVAGGDCSSYRATIGAQLLHQKPVFVPPFQSICTFDQECQNPGRQFTTATRVCTAPNICGSSSKELHVSRLEQREMLRCVLDFWKSCAPLPLPLP